MDRTLPSNPDAERSVLGAILLNRQAIIAVDGWLLPAHFYLETHAWIYDAMLTVHHRHTPPDLTTVTDELRRRERLEPIGGLLYLIDLANSTPTAVHIDYYGRIVEQTAIQRQLIGVGGEIARMGFDERDDLETTLANAEITLQTVTQALARTSGYSALADEIDAYWTRLNDLETRLASGLPTGLLDFDLVTGGLHNGDLLILAARPSVGKSALSLTIAHHAAYHLQRTGDEGQIAVVSLEMSRNQLTDRLISMETGIDVQRLRTGQVRDYDLKAIMSALGRLHDLPLMLDDTAGQTLAALAARARRLHAECPIRLLVVDYLQLLKVTGKENRQQEVGEISRGLKALARELDVPILALSQLNRGVEGRQSKVPMLSDLRESGDLEQDADLVMFIYREELYDKETDQHGIAQIHIAKHRNGPTAVIPLRFTASTTTFSNLEIYRANEEY